MWDYNNILQKRQRHEFQHISLGMSMLQQLFTCSEVCPAILVLYCNILYVYISHRAKSPSQLDIDRGKAPEKTQKAPPISGPSFL